MTFEEALKNVEKNCMKCYPKDGDCIDCEVPLVKEALEKQIPKRPDESYDGYADGYPVIDFSCPRCEREIYDTDHHCICGQAIDWSDIEEASE